MNIRDYLKSRKLLCDGAFGTLFSMSEPDMFPEKANILKPDLVYKIHREYIEKGARLIRTNTFAASCNSLGCTKSELSDNIKVAYDIATRASSGEAFVAGDIGPGANEDIYTIADAFIEKGADIILFETFAEAETIVKVADYIKSKAKDIFIIAQFCVNQYGYTEEGIGANRLMEMCNCCDSIDAMGFNCGVGPAHLLEIFRKLNIDTDKFLTALPNASYPSVIQDRMEFFDNVNYFADVMGDISEYVDIMGGCCGTKPSYIEAIKKNVNFDIGFKHHHMESRAYGSDNSPKRDGSFFAGTKGRKLIAVELDPPKNSDCSVLMETANYLKNKGVDVITFADSPSGRTRADSILMSMKVARETGVNVMPHICCRDKNTIAISSMLLGAYINGIRNFLVITGDPVPNTAREVVKGVFNFDSVRLMSYMQDMNEDNFKNDKLYYGGAINYARRNIDLEIERIQKKMSAGAEFFLTQPVFDDEDIERLKYIRSKVDCKMLVGIMPLVSSRNAAFIKNEITGITIPDWVEERFDPSMTREEAQKTGIEIAKEVMNKVDDFADGYYFVIPFNRLSIAQELIK